MQTQTPSKRENATSCRRFSVVFSRQNLVISVPIKCLVQFFLTTGVKTRLKPLAYHLGLKRRCRTGVDQQM